MTPTAATSATLSHQNPDIRVVRSPGVPRQRADECRPWTGDEGAYQERAATALFVERAVTVHPWHWISTNCGEPTCLLPEHLVATAPQHLAYPYRLCVYCGLSGYTRDHLLPMTVTGRAARRHVLTVPACRECNSVIGDRRVANITVRRSYAQQGIRRKYRRALRTLDWTNEQLNEFGPTLRSCAIKALEVKRITLGRLAWPWDVSYDLRALELSGIEDPFATGILGDVA